MDEIHTLAERLQKVKQFNNLPIEAVENIIASGTVRHYARGEIAFHEDDPCAGLFVLISGQVNLSKLSQEGKEGILNTLNPVIMFNEVAALDGGLNPVTASAHTEIRVWQLSYEKFQQLLLQYPLIGISLLGVLARRNRLLLTHYGDLSFRTVQARLAKHLLDLSQQGSRPIDRKEHPIKLIAARVITTPEAISRTLKTLNTMRVISCSRREIEILDLPRLQNLAQIDL